MTSAASIDVGEHRVTLIRDLMIACPLRVMLSAAQRPIWEPIAGPTDDDGRVPLPVNSRLIETGERKILIDVGDGFRPERPAEKNGHLLEHLDALGTAPEAIDTVFITHLHTDHVAQSRELYSGAHASTQPRDPAKAAALRHVLESDDPPLRLLLGRKAAAIAPERIRARLAEWERWDEVARDADFDSVDSAAAVA